MHKLGLMVLHFSPLSKRFRLSKVTREGEYVPSDVPKQLVYGTMVYVRQTIVADASNALSRAVCIATRYSAVRRQFGAHNGGIETQVLIQKSRIRMVVYTH